jgi:hypothetical protein
MRKKSVEADDLVNAVIVPPSKETLRLLARRGKRAPGFLQIPAQIMARIELCDLDLPESWCVLCALQWLEFRADKKGEPLKLTNPVPAMLGVSRKLKYRALDELVAREFILPYVKSSRASPLIKLNRKFQK